MDVIIRCKSWLRQGQLPNKDAYSRLLNSRLCSWRIAAADADERRSRLPKKDTGGSDALCLGANPFLSMSDQ